MQQLPRRDRMAETGHATRSCAMDRVLPLRSFSLTSPGVVNMRRTVFFAAAFAVVCVALSARSALAQQTDVIRGRVTGPDTLAIKGVSVTATSYQGNVSKKAETDKNGRFTIIFPNGEGDYWLDFRAIGFAPKRFEIKRVDQEE